MPGPTGLLAIALGPVGAMLEIAGQYVEQSRNEERLLYNQQLARQAAMDALSRGALEAGRLRSDTTKLIGEQKVGYATSGVDVTSGTPASIIGESRMLGELDAQTLLNNAIREAWGFQQKAEQLGKDLRASREAAALRAFGTLLGGAGQSAGMAAEYGG